MLLFPVFLRLPLVSGRATHGCLALTGDRRGPNPLSRRTNPALFNRSQRCYSFSDHIFRKRNIPEFVSELLTVGQAISHELL